MTKTALVLGIVISLGLSQQGVANAQIQSREPARLTEYFNRVVDAIYVIEGGQRAKVAYGICSVKVSSAVEARQVCLNTVRNNYRRWKNHKGPQESFRSFLGKRYCPPQLGGDNRYWLRNLSHYVGEPQD